MKTLPAPQQERSRQMLQRLLRATITVLDRDGLEGATIPAIASSAGVAPASVYRRFADKDALIRTALESVLTSSSNSLHDSLAPERFTGKPIAKAVHALIASINAQYTGHPRLISAVKRFSERPAERKFEIFATEIFAANFRMMVSALSKCTEMEGVRGRESKIEFALLTIVSAIELMMLEPNSLWNELDQGDAEQMQKKWATMFVAYVRA